MISTNPAAPEPIGGREPPDFLLLRQAMLAFFLFRSESGARSHVTPTDPPDAAEPGRRALDGIAGPSGC